MNDLPEVPAAADAAIRAILKDFKPSGDRSGFARAGRPNHRVPLDPSDFPESAFLGYVLEHIGLTDLGRHEKLAWEYPFLYGAVPCSVALEKFGLRLYVERSAVSGDEEVGAVTEQITNTLSRATRVAERHIFRSFAESQMHAGKVTVLNQSRRLRQMYGYFREGAEAAYAGRGRLPERTPDGWTRIMPKEQEAFYNTFAMVTAYFSWLEHILVLAHPFVTGAAPESAIRDFARLRWRDKFKRLLPLRDRPVMRAYNRLVDLSEDYRNPWAHGALDPRHGAIAFHLPGFGAVPAGIRPSDFSAVFYPVPFGEDGFNRAVTELEAVDRFLHEHAATRLAMRWIESGLDVAFDSESRVEYAAASSEDLEAFEEFIQYSAHMADQHDNMDW